MEKRCYAVVVNDEHCLSNKPFMLSVIMLSVIMLSVILLSVVVPPKMVSIKRVQPWLSSSLSYNALI
jgi:hypothetical protein